MLTYYEDAQGTHIIGQGDMSPGSYNDLILSGGAPGGFFAQQGGSVRINSGLGVAPYYADGNIIADAGLGYVTIRSQGNLSTFYQGAITISAQYGKTSIQGYEIEIAAGASGINLHLPTVAGASGTLWNNAGTVKVVP